MPPRNHNELSLQNLELMFEQIILCNTINHVPNTVLHEVVYDLKSEERYEETYPSRAVKA
jgi:hypothetical protein